MDGELKPQISLTRSHIEGKTADIDLFNGAKNGRPSGEDEEVEHRRGLPFEVIKVRYFPEYNAQLRLQIVYKTFA